ncbi:MAG: hypothetical protein COB77_04695 [Gammaproteobacteria bacterium]|nr:MAG: hypothetical protein COB77_04695 [Gammaproteobacteria bacterium]
MIKQLTVLFFISYGGVVWAEDNVDFLQVSEAFSECSALQTTLSDIIADSDDARAVTLKKLADEANIIAEDFLQAGGFKKERAKSQYDSHYNWFQTMLIMSTDNYESFSATVKPVIDKCAALYRLQFALITERRKQNIK